MSYFPIFIDMTDRQVLVVGAGSVASRRVGVLEKFGAAITVIAPNKRYGSWRIHGKSV